MKFEFGMGVAWYGGIMTKLQKIFPLETLVYHVRYKAGPWPVTGYERDSKGVLRVLVGHPHSGACYLPEDLAIMPNLSEIDEG